VYARLLKEGHVLFKQGRYQEAKARYVEALGAMPGEEAKDGIEVAEKESAAQATLNAAEVALGKNQLSQAAAALRTIDPDSLLADKADATRKLLKDAVAGRAKDARARLEAGDVEGARAAL